MRKLDQTVPYGKGCGGCPVLAGRFIEDVGEVMGDRSLAEYQFLGDLGVGQASGYQAQHLYLSCGQSCGIRRQWG